MEPVEAPSLKRRPRRQSAGILLYRGAGESLEVLLVHPGGPLWAGRDDGAWSIPKGEYEDGEEPLDAARREFREELGVSAPLEPAEDLGEVRQRSGKLVHGFALAGDIDAAEIESNTFLLEWPPRSGRQIEAPEVDRAAWFTLAQARVKVNPAQVAFLERLRDLGH
jgi:predicted NUDIX family NTP pyrophosphohydrolase